MFLLILKFRLVATNNTVFFKFHYVSINSPLFYLLSVGNPTLNSIMFLLIQNFIRAIIIRKVTLNSIMFLLILVHSVLGAWIYLFKFHYVSINSCMRQIAMDTRFSLNSIMFLLIQVVERWTLKHFQTLNSIMFLLIHVRDVS